MIPRLVFALCLAVLLAACAPAQAEKLPSDVQVTADMKDYSITLNVTSVKAGVVKFGVRNLGGMAHQFDLIRTDLAADKLPVDGASAKAKEDGLVKQVVNIGPGKVVTVSADLQPGHYVIICNVAGHYQLGMRAGLTVE